MKSGGLFFNVREQTEEHEHHVYKILGTKVLVYPFSVWYNNAMREYKDTWKKKQTLTLDRDLVEKAKAKAKGDHRSLSNYVELLIMKDLEGNK